MAFGLLSQRVSDLCLGKPALRPLPVSSSVRDTILALRSSGESHLSVWSCDHRASSNSSSVCVTEGDVGACRCAGKVCMVDVVCYLSREENLRYPGDALKAPLTEILPKSSDGIVRHVETSSSLSEAIDLILQGAQNLVVPVQNKRNTRRNPHSKHLSTRPTHHGDGLEFCWLTQEDVIRFLLNSIALFSPLHALSIDFLGLVTTDFLAVDYDSPASSAIGPISLSLAHQTSVAVTDPGGALIGEISPLTLACCDETVAAAIATLSCGELMAYIDWGEPREDLARAVKSRLKEWNMIELLEELSLSSSSSISAMSSSGSHDSSSSDEEGMGSPKETLARVARHSRSPSHSARMVRSSKAIVCHPMSSLVAVMVQAIAHRVNCVWVTEEDCGLVGIVTFSSMLEVFREHLEWHDDGVGEIGGKV